MKIQKTSLLLSTLLTTSSLWAQSPTTASNPTPPPYGDNPNIFQVLAHKTQEKAQSIAEKIGAETEKGIAKVKPKVDQVWENTKTYSAEQAAIAKENSQKAAQAVNQKWQDTKQAVIGQPNPAPAPIEQRPLSQSSTNSETSQPAERSTLQSASEHPATIYL